ncbi:isocitrate lyase/phosphoenolpyruvate mutase family protein [Bradyrhizobium sp. CCGUVB23]|uniref:isocitrate lyase/phosphoenolpyruvate mutase family protein n=1 Tax=Bradyrhizobium sp. CCGUVB23 TaxID=2949630 RepID=UPI003531B348
MEAHDGLSGAIAQRAGFKALWASGRSIASSLGYRDANEASWSQLVDVLERIVDSSELPVLVDGDTGFGNFNNARLLARKLRQRGAAALALQDSCFPKMNSCQRHVLADIGEFSGRLRAVRDTVGRELVLVAGIEALIVGREIDEAVSRAHAYADAGADATLIHSRKSTAEEIFEFASAWRNRLPVVIIPTKYYQTPVSAYREARISTVIWANHSMRAAILVCAGSALGSWLGKGSRVLSPILRRLLRFSIYWGTTNSSVPKRDISNPMTKKASSSCATGHMQFRRTGAMHPFHRCPPLNPAAQHVEI